MAMRELLLVSIRKYLECDMNKSKVAAQFRKAADWREEAAGDGKGRGYDKAFAWQARTTRERRVTCSLSSLLCSALSQKRCYVTAGCAWKSGARLGDRASEPHPDDTHRAASRSMPAPVNQLSLSKISEKPNLESRPPGHTMSLVQYPDSESDDSAGDTQNASVPAQKPKPKPKPPLKRKRSPPAAGRDDLPPLPAAFHDLYATSARVGTSDDPSLHGGRKRAVPHVDGNWPSHVYLECM
jgi:hypothetical protein